MTNHDVTGTDGNRVVKGSFKMLSNFKWTSAGDLLTFKKEPS